jgi:dienelactone hydrolase
MRHRLIAGSMLSMALLGACTSSTHTAESPSPSPTLLAEAAFAAMSGTYRTTSGETWVVSLQGLLVSLHTGVARALAPEGNGRFGIGPSMGIDHPAQGEAAFSVDPAGMATTMTLHGSVFGDVSANRVPYASREVHFQSGGVTLAGTLSEPIGEQLLPGIVLVHGSGVQPRPLFSLWANVYNSMGFAVLNYDKRGTGESGGTYPGELATGESLSIYANDAVAAARFLQAQPEIDPKRVGFHGGSQGGWIVPLALERAPDLAFGILASAPAVTTNQVDVYQNFSGDSSVVPSESLSSIERQVLATTGGYDPVPALRALHVPTIWIYGSLDRQVPVDLSVRNLRTLRGKDLTIDVLPGGWHGLTVTPNGLEPEAAESLQFVPGLFTDIASWLHARGYATPPP